MIPARLSKDATRLVAAIGVMLLAGCGGGGGDDAATTGGGEELSAGSATTGAGGVEAFEQVVPNADAATRRVFERGNNFFESSWVTAPSSTTLRDGRGPLSNAASCAACHVHDGRGAPDPALGLLVRMSSPLSAVGWRQPATGGGGSRLGLLASTSLPPFSLWQPAAEPLAADIAYGPVPGYGDQFQPIGLVGGTTVDAIPGEGTVTITYTAVPGTYGDGTPYTLRSPTYTLDGLNYGALPDGVVLSPRMAPGVFGDGLLEAIPDSRLLALADPDDTDHDGISGRVNRVPDLRSGGEAIGRFGWKAGMPSIEQQSAGALHGDIGITTSLFPDEDLTDAQRAVISPATLATRSGGSPEAADSTLSDITTYVRTLAVPMRRNWTDAQVVRGRDRFAATGCAACHVAQHTTGPAANPALANQVIRPFTDLLLHDMGPELADGRPEHLAGGSEWRTPPLWGLGLTHVVSGHTFMLHDGRARGTAEAILWHGGEAAPAREAFRTASAAQRADLLAFLDSL